MLTTTPQIHKSQPYLVHCSRRTPRFFGLSWTSLEQNLPLPEMLVQYWSYLACFPPTTDACDFNAAPNVRKPATSSPALPVLTLLSFFCGIFFLTSSKTLRFLKMNQIFLEGPLRYQIIKCWVSPLIFSPDHPSPVSVSRKRGWE